MNAIRTIDIIPCSMNLRGIANNYRRQYNIDTKWLKCRDTFTARKLWRISKFSVNVNALKENLKEMSHIYKKCKCNLKFTS